jgi:dolichol kinase
VKWIKDSSDQDSVRADVKEPLRADASSANFAREFAPSYRPLTYRELKRRFWHMSPGFLPLILQLVPHRDPLSPILLWIIVAFTVVIAGRILVGFRQIQRQGEGAGVAAVSGYALSVLLTALLFPRHLELGLSVLAILAFGDGSATLFGLMFRGPRLPWNHAKSWTGLLAFVAVGSCMTSWIYWGEAKNPEAADPAVSFALAIALTAPAVVLAAVAESIRSKVNDNVRVGIAAVIGLLVLHMFRPL